MKSVQKSILILVPLLASFDLFAQQQCTDGNTITARVAAIDQAWIWNRYGALQPHGMMYALLTDLRNADTGETLDSNPNVKFEAGKVLLRPSKRPRPLVLRVNRGDCLKVELHNLLDELPRNHFLTADPANPGKCLVGSADDGCGDQPKERKVGFLINGMTLANSIESSGSFVGRNPESLVARNDKKVFTYYGAEEGTYFVYSPAALRGGDGNGGSTFAGLFAAVNVEPENSKWYRSQVTEEQLTSSKDHTGGGWKYDYSKLLILRDREIVHSDLTAIIDTRKSKFSLQPRHCLASMPSASNGEVPEPSLCAKPDVPFREFTVIFHDESGAKQAFPEFDAPLGGTESAKAVANILHSVRDGFAINYGTAGAGAEVLANRKHLGPVKDCPECFLEEFFLSSWAVGDPAMVVEHLANLQAKGQIYEGKPSQFALYPDDPSNVYHSYLNDRLVFRNLHAGPKEHHVFHLHAHQWLQTPNHARTSYLDSQTIGPGGTYTYEIAYGGSGNRNRSAGDSIFHCHFYPHFAQGMWALWRVHDVLEEGTKLKPGSAAKGWAEPAPGARTLPDGEIAAGTPIPAIVPLPGQAMPPTPTKTHPGYPFFIPGRPGHRPPSPPLDYLELSSNQFANGGLPRHLVLSGEYQGEGGTLNAAPLFVTGNVRSIHKELVKLNPLYLPENGTKLEQAAMQFHAQGIHASRDPETGVPKEFYTNGKKPQAGAPYADPCPVGAPIKKFLGGVMQFDMIFTKTGWHTPQARIIALRDDIPKVAKGDLAPQPFFFRVHSGDCIEFQHSNLAGKEYEQDAFQIRTPTDIIGQHIHLVKFDVLASDGGANGFNYEDGTMAPKEVAGRIEAIRQGTFYDELDANDTPIRTTKSTACGSSGAPSLACPEALTHPWASSDSYFADTKFKGGQITVQRWYADPQLYSDQVKPNSISELTHDKTLDTVFTHDHFGASSHQQIGLYAGLIVEPNGTEWFSNDKTQTPLFGRPDGGPTSWTAIIRDKNKEKSFREFALEFQDYHIAFEKNKGTVLGRPINAPGQQPVVDSSQPLGVPSPVTRLVKYGCPLWPHCPEAISAADTGVMSINYRAEPLLPRLLSDSDVLQGTADSRSDLAHVFRTLKDRAKSDLNKAQKDYPLVGGITRTSWPVLSEGVQVGDPFTPLLEAYENDRFKIRVLAGAHEHEHNLRINGLTWQNMQHEPNSGFRSFLTTALSEHFELNGLADIPKIRQKLTNVDYLYRIGASVDDMWYGNWGLFRVYNSNYKTPEKWLPPLEFGSDQKKVSEARQSEIERTKLSETISSGEKLSSPAKEFLALGKLLPVSRQEETNLDEVDTELLQLADTVRYTGERILTAARSNSNVRTNKVSLDEASSQLRKLIAEITPLRDRLKASGVGGPAEQAGQARTFIEKLTQIRKTIPKIAVDDEEYSDQPVCPSDAPLRIFRIYAHEAKSLLAEKRIVYHRFPKNTWIDKSKKVKWIDVSDPLGLLYANESSLNADRKSWNPVNKIEPLVLRARAGECIEIELHNELSAKLSPANGFNTLPSVDERFNFNELTPSSEVGLNPQLMRYHAGVDDGMNVGLNPPRTVQPGKSRVYRWFAGQLSIVNVSGKFQAEYSPVEFGSIGLAPADPITQGSRGLYGMLIVEPEISLWLAIKEQKRDGEPASTPAMVRTQTSARVLTLLPRPDRIREHVLISNGDGNFQLRSERRRAFWAITSYRPVRRVGMADGCEPNANCVEAGLDGESVDAVETGHKSFNYRSEAPWMRQFHPAASPLSVNLEERLHSKLLSYSNYAVPRPIQTNEFCSVLGESVRLRVASPSGHGRNHVLTVAGHEFYDLPFIQESRVLGANPAFAIKGSQDGIGPGSNGNILFSSRAGGRFKVTGDYLIRDMYSWGFDNGLWAIFRVESKCP